MLHARFTSNRLICRIPASAFASIVAVLAAGFMLLQSMTFTFHRGVSAQLPRVRNAITLWRAQREDALLIVVLRDGQLFFDSQRVTPQELTGKLRAGVCSAGPRSVYIKADERVQYSAVLSVLDSIRSAGFANVAFLTANPD